MDSFKCILTIIQCSEKVATYLMNWTSFNETLSKESLDVRLQLINFLDSTCYKMVATVNCKNGYSPVKVTDIELKFGLVQNIH